jgi:hypothetical protein
MSAGPTFEPTPATLLLRGADDHHADLVNELFDWGLGER